MTNHSSVIQVNDCLTFTRPLIESKLTLSKNVAGKPRGECDLSEKVRIVKNSDDTSRTFMDDLDSVWQVTAPDCKRETDYHTFRRFPTEEGGSWVRRTESYMFLNPGNSNDITDENPVKCYNNMNINATFTSPGPLNITSPIKDDFGFLDPTTIEIIMQPYSAIDIVPNLITGIMKYIPNVPTDRYMDVYRFRITRDDGALVTVTVLVRVNPIS